MAEEGSFLRRKHAGRAKGSKNAPKPPGYESMTPAERKRVRESRYMNAKPSLGEPEKKRLQELAGHHVPIVEIAAVLRREFNLTITEEELDAFFRDEILVGRAYAAERISKKTIDCALEGSATAQKTLFDQIQEAGRREERQNGGRQIRQIRLVVVNAPASRLRSEPLANHNQNPAKAREVLAKNRAKRREERANAIKLRDPDDIYASRLRRQEAEAEAYVSEGTEPPDQGDDGEAETEGGGLGVASGGFGAVEGGSEG